MNLHLNLRIYIWVHMSTFEFTNLHLNLRIFIWIYYRRDKENNSPTADDVVVAVRADQTNRPRRKATKRVTNLFVNEDSEPEPLYDSDAEGDQEYTEAQAIKEAGNLSPDDESDDGSDDDIPPEVVRYWMYIWI